jgi:retron-type reverse transcriptase
MEFEFKDSKRLKNIYPLVFDAENLIRSQYNAQRSKKESAEIRKFNENISDNLYKLYEMLKSETYQPGKYRTKTVYETKKRVLMIAPFFPDRIIHHCIINVLGNVWARSFIDNTYACIKGRGIHKCMEDIHSDLLVHRKRTKYCLKIDVKKFYDNVDHSVLKTMLRYRIADESMLRLLDTIIDSTGTDKGLPIGNYTSQYLANLYLSYFDRWAKEEVNLRYYYRYMDDIVILHRSKEYLHDILDQIGLYFGAELKLEIKHNWQIFPVDARGIDFVGFKQNHYGILLRKGILMRFYAKYKEICERYQVEDITTIKHLFPSEYGWITKCSEKHTNYIFKNCLQYGTKCINNRTVGRQ